MHFDGMDYAINGKLGKRTRAMLCWSKMEAMEDIKELLDDDNVFEQLCPEHVSEEWVIDRY